MDQEKQSGLYLKCFSWAIQHLKLPCLRVGWVESSTQRHCLVIKRGLFPAPVHTPLLREVLN